MRRWMLLRAEASWHHVLSDSFLLPEPETLLWYGLWFIVALLAFLKGIGVLLLSWWWVVLPVSLPFLAFAAIITMIVVLKLLEKLIR